jgi:hypothetical protein
MNTRTWIYGLGGAALGLLLTAGCSKGGADDTRTGPSDPLDGLTADQGRADLRGRPDLARPQMRSQVGFGAAVQYGVDSLAFQLAVGRIDGDGSPDLVVGGQTRVTVYRGRGDGTFEMKPLSMPLGATWQVSAADLNGDGLADLALTSRGQLQVALNQGDGRFGPASTYLSDKAAMSVAAADLNADGRPDLVVGSYQDYNIHVLMNQGDGTFRPTARYPAADGGMSNPIWLLAADVNGDGRPDVISSNYGTGSLSLLAGKGDGTLQPAQILTRVSRPVAADLIDLNLDGRPDLAVIREDEPVIAVFLGNGDGTFTPAEPLRLSAVSGQGLRLVDA